MGLNGFSPDDNLLKLFKRKTDNYKTITGVETVLYSLSNT